MPQLGGLQSGTYPRRVTTTGRRAEVSALLLAAEEVVTLAPGVDDDGEEYPVEVTLVSPADLDSAQVGYATDVQGRDLTSGEGAWQPDWLVIGTDHFLGDPYFVDLSQPDMPVFTAVHGAGKWDPQPVADSLRAFLTGRD